MPDSVRESIIANMATALGNITTGNGYNNTLASVQRFMQTGLSVASVPTVVVNFERETKSLGPGDRTECDLEVSVDCWAIHDTAAVSGSSATLVDSLVYDVEKALMADTSRGGAARDFHIESVVPFRLEEGAFVGATVVCRVKYQHLQTDPGTGRN